MEENGTSAEGGSASGGKKSKLICPECKNSVNLSAHEELALHQVVECDKCGITLAIKDMSNPVDIKTDIVDEGK